jgi:hypothetical protein
LISQEHGLSRGVDDAAAVSMAVAALATRLAALEAPTDIAQHVADVTGSTLGLDAAVFLADGELRGMVLAGSHPADVPVAELVDVPALLEAIGTDQPAALPAKDSSRELACFPMSQAAEIEGALVLIQGVDETRPLVELNVAEAFARVGAVGLARARASQAARATEQLLGITVDNVPIGMAMYGADRILRLSSTALERIIGARMEPGSCAEQAFDAFEPVTGVDAERVGEVTAALAGGEAVEHEVELRDRRSGRVLRLECWVVPLPDGGVGLVLQDVTRRWQAELDRDNLLRHLVSAQEEERRRLAADLHDDLIQALVAGLMDLDLLETRLGGDADTGTRIRRTRGSFEHALLEAGRPPRPGGRGDRVPHGPGGGQQRRAPRPAAPHDRQGELRGQRADGDRGRRRLRLRHRRHHRHRRRLPPGPPRAALDGRADPARRRHLRAGLRPGRGHQGDVLGAPARRRRA